MEAPLRTCLTLLVGWLVALVSKHESLVGFLLPTVFAPLYFLLYSSRNFLCRCRTAASDPPKADVARFEYCLPFRSEGKAINVCQQLE